MSSQEEQIQQRRANLDELKKLGVETYPHAFERRHTIAQLVDGYANGWLVRPHGSKRRRKAVTSGCTRGDQDAAVAECRLGSRLN